MISAVIYPTIEFNEKSIGNFIQDFDKWQARQTGKKPEAKDYLFLDGDRIIEEGFVAVGSGIAFRADDRFTAIEGLAEAQRKRLLSKGIKI